MNQSARFDLFLGFEPTPAQVEVAEKLRQEGWRDDILASETDDGALAFVKKMRCGARPYEPGWTCYARAVVPADVEARRVRGDAPVLYYYPWTF